MIIADVITFSVLAIAALVYSIFAGYWQGLSFNPPWLATVMASPVLTYGIIAGIVLLILLIHCYYRRLFANSIAKKLGKDLAGDLSQAFRKSTSIWRSILSSKPSGWGWVSRKRIDALRDDTDRFVQRLNDNFAKPSGD